MKIAVSDDYQNSVPALDCFRLLAEHEVTVFNDTLTDVDALAARFQDFDALVLIRERTVITDALLARLPKLKLISQTGKISNHVNLADCTRHGVAFAEGKGSPVAPAEMCWAMIMAASRQLVPYCSRLKAGQWQQSGKMGLGRTLNGLTLGIWGYGKLGKRIAQFGTVFGMNILIWGREASREQAVADGFQAAASKREFFQAADVLSLHLRLNEATQGCVELADLQAMKADALLVNTSRAELIAPGALVEALWAGRPGFAAVDVYDNEPAGAEMDALLALDNVLCTPHIGYVEQNGYELYFRAAFENVNAFFKGEAENIANPEVLKLMGVLT